MTKGIRILDKKDRIVLVQLEDILEKIWNGGNLKWCILCCEAVGIPQSGWSIIDFQNKVDKSENGLLISWNELNALSTKVLQFIDLTVIRSTDKEALHQYATPQQMYESCDIIIEMIDTSYWEVFSKDTSLINLMAVDFKDSILLESNYQNDW